MALFFFDPTRCYPCRPADVLVGNLLSGEFTPLEHPRAHGRGQLAQPENWPLAELRQTVYPGGVRLWTAPDKWTGASMWSFVRNLTGEERGAVARWQVKVPGAPQFSLGVCRGRTSYEMAVIFENHVQLEAALLNYPYYPTGPEAMAQVARLLNAIGQTPAALPIEVQRAYLMRRLERDPTFGAIHPVALAKLREQYPKADIVSAVAAYAQPGYTPVEE